MSNHALLLPKIPVSRLMKSMKNFTAREANRAPGRTGEPFGEAYPNYYMDTARKRS